MIIIQARIPVHSDKRNIAYQSIHDFVDRTRTENGCLYCEALISLEDPDLIVIHQEWRGANDLSEHASGPHLDAFLELLPEFVDGEVSTMRFEASSAEDEALEAPFDGELDDEFASAPQGVTLH